MVIYSSGINTIFEQKTRYHPVAHLFYTSVPLGFGEYHLVYAFCYTSLGQWSYLALFFLRALVMPWSSFITPSFLQTMHLEVTQRFQLLSVGSGLHSAYALSLIKYMISFFGGVGGTQSQLLKSVCGGFLTPFFTLFFNHASMPSPF